MNLLFDKRLIAISLTCAFLATSILLFSNESSPTNKNSSEKFVAPGPVLSHNKTLSTHRRNQILNALTEDELSNSGDVIPIHKHVVKESTAPDPANPDLNFPLNVVELSRSRLCDELKKLYKKLNHASKALKVAEKAVRAAIKALNSSLNALDRAQRKLPGVQKAIAKKESLVERLQDKFNKVYAKYRVLHSGIAALNRKIYDYNKALPIAIAAHKAAEKHLHAVQKAIALAPRLTRELKRQRRSAFLKVKSAKREVNAQKNRIKRTTRQRDILSAQFGPINTLYIQLHAELGREKRGLASLRSVLQVILNEVGAAENAVANARNVLKIRQDAVDAAQAYYDQVKVEYANTECPEETDDHY